MNPFSLLLHSVLFLYEISLLLLLSATDQCGRLLVFCLLLFFLSLHTLQCKREGFVQRLKDEQGEGCNIHGFVDVNKVAGNFHFAPGKSLDHAFNFLQDMLNFQPENYNASRIIFFYPQS